MRECALEMYPMASALLLHRNLSEGHTFSRPSHSAQPYNCKIMKERASTVRGLRIGVGPERR